MNASVSRRLRKVTDAGGSDSSSSSASLNKPESSPLFSACVLLVVTILIVACMLGGSAFHTASLDKKSRLTTRTQLFWHSADVARTKETSSKNATGEVTIPDEPFESAARDALPILHDVYGKYMNKVLHVGPGTCDVVATLLQEENAEAWGIEPWDIASPSTVCRNLIKKGLVRVGEVHRSLPYRSGTFSLVFATDTLEHLTSRQLNRTLPELIRLTQRALVVFIASQPSQEGIAARQMQTALKPVKHHNRTWWARRFEMAGLEENEAMAKQFDNLRGDKAYQSSDYVFHFLVKHLD